MTNLTPMGQYYDLLKDILDNGYDSDDRTGVGCREVFGRQLRFDLREGFPLLTGKLTPFKLVAGELLWFISGSTSNDDLRRISGISEGRDTIWEEWRFADELGPIYGKQWRDFRGYRYTIDQFALLMDGLRERPFSRRHIVSAWNPDDLPDERLTPQQNVERGNQSLAPCHMSFQMNVRKLTLAERMSIYRKSMTTEEHMACQDHLSGYPIDQYHAKLTEWGFPELGISCHMQLRSSDTFLGLPFNIASYALLTHMIAHVTGYEPLELIVSIGSAHIYKNHMDQVEELLSRKHSAYELPKLEIVGHFKSIDDFDDIDNFKVVGYKCLPAIKAPVAV